MQIENKMRLLIVLSLEIFISNCQYTYESDGCGGKCVFNYNGPNLENQDTKPMSKLNEIEQKLTMFLNNVSQKMSAAKLSEKMKTEPDEWKTDMFQRLKNLENKIEELETSAKTGLKRCPTNFTRFENHCYYFFTGFCDWFWAGRDCISKGAHLVSIETAQEDLFLLQMIRGTPGLDEPTGYWTGATNMAIKQTWIWSHSGQPLNYSRFHPGGDSHNGYFAVELHKKNPMRAWDDTQPHIKMGHICELELE